MSLALSLDPKLFVDIMGSYRRYVLHNCAYVGVAQYTSRGKSTCGDIDVMITRSPDDGKTHAGMRMLLFRSQQLETGICTLLILHCQELFPSCCLRCAPQALSQKISRSRPMRVIAWIAHIAGSASARRKRARTHDQGFSAG